MNPDSDSRADRLDEAIELQRSGEDQLIEDEELLELVQLASRLEKELPPHLPDPAFRENLKHQMLAGDAFVQPYEPQAPIDLSQERWSRRIVDSPWRVSAVAAACLVVVAVAFVAASNPFDGGSGGSEEVTSFAPVDADGPSDQMALDTADDAPTAERWFAATFPPFDVEHIVLPPMMIGFLPLSERRKPNVEVLGLADMIDHMEMPETATVYYLNSPPDPASALAALQSTLGVQGELIPGNGDGEPFRVVDEHQNDLMRWDATSAFFHFQGGLLEDPVDDLLDEGADAADIARRFLELIGFDLHTIEYEQRIIQRDDGVSEIQWRPANFPDTALGVTLGGSVYVSEHGAIVEAQLYWLSLVDIEVVPLRDADRIIRDVEAGHGYAPPASGVSDEIMIEVEDLVIVHVLTRLSEANFVLQPAVKLVGDYGSDVVSEIPGPARYLVPAVENGD